VTLPTEADKIITRYLALDCELNPCRKDEFYQTRIEERTNVVPRYIYNPNKKKKEEEDRYVQRVLRISVVNEFNHVVMNEFVNKGKSIDEIQAQLNKLIENHTIIGHSILNDLRGLEHTGINLPWGNFKYIDIGKEFRASNFGLRHRSENDIIGLGEMYNILAYPRKFPTYSHHPVFDARATMIIWDNFANNSERNLPLTLDEEQDSL